MKFLGELYVSCRSMSSDPLEMVIRFKSGAAWPGSSAAPRFTENTGDSTNDKIYPVRTILQI